MEAVLDHNIRKDTFLVKWLGFEEKDATWEPRKNIPGSVSIYSIYYFLQNDDSLSCLILVLWKGDIFAICFF